MNRDIRRLAAQYIDEVIADQQKLGYTEAVPRAVREEAVKHAKAALEDLARSTRPSKEAVAA